MKVNFSVRLSEAHLDLLRALSVLVYPGCESRALTPGAEYAARRVSAEWPEFADDGISADGGASHRLRLTQDAATNLRTIAASRKVEVGALFRAALLDSKKTTSEVAAMGDAPIQGTEAAYVVRGNRAYASRVIEIWNRPSWLLTVIGGPLVLHTLPVGIGVDDKRCVLYTAYAGPLAPREPGDPSIASWDELCESRAFWAQHALALTR